MIPPPMISIRFGISSKARALVESHIRSSSYGIPGIWTGRDPTAIIRSLNVILTSSSSVFTRSDESDISVPNPVIRSTFLALQRPSRPPVRVLTIDSLWLRTVSRSIFGAENVTPTDASSPASAITSDRWSNALEGIQPTLRHTPPRMLCCSMRVTDLPKSAALKAAVYPPGPPPRTTKSFDNSFIDVLLYYYSTNITQ